MTKRKKSAQKAPTVTRKKSPKAFDCPFCDSDKIISVKLRRGTGIGVLSCRNCPRVFYETQITPATKEIDVYAEWYQTLIANKA